MIKRASTKKAPPVAKTAPGKPARPEREADAITERDLLKLAPGALAASFVRSKLHDKQLAVAGLAAPSDWEGAMPELPDDIAAEDHASLANLMAAFVNALSTAMWYQSRAYIEHGYYEEIADYLTSIALLGSDQSNEQKRNADAKTTSAVVAANALAKETYADYVRFRDLAATLKLKHATVSRVGGFVGEEAESGATGLSGRSTRGNARGADRGSGRGATMRRPRK